MDGTSLSVIPACLTSLIYPMVKRDTINFTKSRFSIKATVYLLCTLNGAELEFKTLRRATKKWTTNMMLFLLSRKNSMTKHTMIGQVHSKISKSNQGNILGFKLKESLEMIKDH